MCKKIKIVSFKKKINFVTNESVTTDHKNGDDGELYNIPAVNGEPYDRNCSCSGAADKISNSEIDRNIREYIFKEFPWNSMKIMSLNYLKVASGY